MQLFFNNSYTVARALPYPKVWNYAKLGLQRNLQKVQSYYKDANFSVKSNHPLVRMLNTLGVNMEHDLERYYDIVNTKTFRYSLQLKFTSPVYSGILHDGIFYGPKVREIIILDDTFVNPYSVQADWKNYQSVRVLDHPRSDLDLLPLNGKDTGIEEGTATIVMNVAAMAVQFREFLIEEKIGYDEGISPETVAQFVHKYVLPNMLPTHLDCAIFNRLVNRLIGKPQGSATKDHPFYLLGYSKYVDQVWAVLCANISNTSYDFWTILRSVPLVSSKNAQEFMKLPELAPTRQIKWAEFITRLKCIEFLIHGSALSGKKASSKDLNYLMNSIIKYNSDGSLRHVLPGDIYYDLLRRQKDILQAAGSNYVLR